MKDYMPDFENASVEKLLQWKRQYEAEILHCKENGFEHDVQMLIESLNNLNAVMQKRGIFNWGIIPKKWRSDER